MRLTTCTNGRDVTWDTALARGYTQIPKPHTNHPPAPLRAPGWRELIGLAWRTRHEHHGLLAALRQTRTEAILITQQQNAQRQAALDAATDEWHTQRQRAREAFRDRHVKIPSEIVYKLDATDPSSTEPISRLGRSAPR